MLSKSTLKQITSLEMKKYRKESGLFVAEGGKTVNDLIACGMVAEKVLATREWLDSHTLQSKQEVIEVTEEELKRASFLRAPQGILALFRQPSYKLDYEAPTKRLCLALDNVQDPGNLGTIVRIADWFGIEEIYCSNGSADIYNPKCIQATMGAAGRVKVFYIDLPEFLSTIKEKAPIYGTFLDGKNLYQTEARNAKNGLIVMGSESFGISKELEAKITSKITVKKVLTLKTAKVKKSAKKLVLTATLKKGKTAIK